MDLETKFGAIREALKATSLDEPSYRQKVTTQCNTLVAHLRLGIRKQLVSQLDNHRMDILPVALTRSLMSECSDFLYLDENRNYSILQSKAIVEDMCYKIIKRELLESCKTFITTNENMSVDVIFNESIMGSRLRDYIDLGRVRDTGTYDAIVGFVVKEQPQSHAASGSRGQGGGRGSRLIKKLSFRRGRN